jgi:hypothetical protein
MLKSKARVVAALLLIATSSGAFAESRIDVDAYGDRLGLDLEKVSSGDTSVLLDGWDIDTTIDDFGGDLDVAAFGHDQDNYVISAPCPVGRHREVVFEASGLNIAVPRCIRN